LLSQLFKRRRFFGLVRMPVVHAAHAINDVAEAALGSLPSWVNTRWPPLIDGSAFSLFIVWVVTHWLWLVVHEGLH